MIEFSFISILIRASSCAEGAGRWREKGLHVAACYGGAEGAMAMSALEGRPREQFALTDLACSPPFIG
jgi:hypothetical protein